MSEVPSLFSVTLRQHVRDQALDLPIGHSPSPTESSSFTHGPCLIFGQLQHLDTLTPCFPIGTTQRDAPLTGRQIGPPIHLSIPEAVNMAQNTLATALLDTGNTTPSS